MNATDQANEPSGQDEDSFANRVRRRAYELWEEEGRPHGKDHEFWYRAEQESRSTGTSGQASEDVPASGPTGSGTDDILPS
jgi:hypothetical protein